MGMLVGRGRLCGLLLAAVMVVACGQTPQGSVPVRRAAGASKVVSKPKPSPSASGLVRVPVTGGNEGATSVQGSGDGGRPVASPVVEQAPLLPEVPSEALAIEPSGVDEREEVEPAVGLLGDPGWHTEITDVKNGVVLGIGTFRCTVKVWHDDRAAQTGVLRVTFKEKDKDSGTPPAVRLLTVDADEMKSFTFEDKNWRTREAEAAIVTTRSTQPLAAFVTSKKNGVVLGVGTYRCEVLVVNPQATSQSGTVVVQFLNQGKAARTPVVRTPVTLAGRTSRVLTFTDKNWQTDDVQVVVE